MEDVNRYIADHLLGLIEKPVYQIKYWYWKREILYSPAFASRESAIGFYENLAPKSPKGKLKAVLNKNGFTVEFLS